MSQKSRSANWKLHFTGGIAFFLIAGVSHAGSSGFLGELDRIDKRKKTVCTITINSTEEKETFRKRLGDEHFNYIELVPDSGSIRNDSWFRQACHSGLKCDVLLVSGHFGGRFFGESGYTLSLEDLEEHSCSADCSGILNHPKEVFLFGCNTLAGKNKDTRTPQEYIRVLTEDGFSRAQAEQVAAFRYSPVGSSNEDRMRKVFKGAGRIYGFDSVGPSGKNVTGFLERYFSSIKDYRSYLDGMNPAVSNKNLARAMSATAFREVPGLSATVQDPVCYLSDPSVSTYDRAVWIRQVLENGADVGQYASHISKYLTSLESQQVELGPKEQEVFDQISRLTKPRALFEKMIGSALNGMLNIQISLANIMRSLRWWDEAKYREQVQHLIGSRLTLDIDTEKVDAFCSLDIVTGLKLSDLESDTSRWTSDYMRAVGCLKPQDPAIHLALLKILVSDAQRGYSAAEALGSIGASGPSFLKEVWNLFETSSEERIQSAATALLLASQSQDESLQLKLVDTLSRSSDSTRLADVRRILGGLKISSGAVQRQLAEIVATGSPAKANLAASVLSEAGVSDSLAQRRLMELLGSPASRNAAILALRAIYETTEELEVLLVDTIRTADSEGKAAAADLLLAVRPRSDRARMAIYTLIRDSKDQNSREQASRIMTYIPAFDPNFQLALAKILVRDSSPVVRRSLAEVFESYPPESEEVQLLLIDDLSTESSFFVRMYLNTALVKSRLSARAQAQVRLAMEKTESKDQKASFAWVLSEQAKKKPVKK